MATCEQKSKMALRPAVPSYAMATSRPLSLGSTTPRTGYNLRRRKSSENGTQNKPLACRVRSGHHPFQAQRWMGQRLLPLRSS